MRRGQKMFHAPKDTGRAATLDPSLFPAAIEARYRSLARQLVDGWIAKRLVSERNRDWLVELMIYWVELDACNYLLEQEDETPHPIDWLRMFF